MKLSEFPYERVDFTKMEKELSDLTKALDKAKSVEEVFSIHKKYYKMQDDVMTAMVLANFRNNIDMTDEFYEKEKDYYDEKMPGFWNAMVEYQKKLYHSPFKKEMEEKIGHVAFKNIELAIKGMDEKLIPLMQKENELTTAYGKLLGTATIEWEGEELNLSLMRPYLTSVDRSVRERAWEKYSAFFEEHKEELNSLYDELVKNRTEQGRLLGYPVHTSAYMPAAAAGKIALAFGDYAYYNIGDRGTRSLQELKELFAGNGMVGYVMKERVDGKLVLEEAVQTLKMKG